MRCPDPIRGHLMRLRARLVETAPRRGPPMPLPPSLIGSGSGGRPRDFVARLRDRGLAVAGPVSLPRGPRPLTLPEGCSRSRRPSTLPEFRLALMQGRGLTARPRRPGCACLPPRTTKRNQLVVPLDAQGARSGSGTGSRNGARLVEGRAPMFRGPISCSTRHFHSPSMNGLEARARFAPMRPKKGLPRPRSSPWTGPRDGGRTGSGFLGGGTAGIDGYITKPLRKSDLHQMIRGHAPEGMSPVPDLPPILDTAERRVTGRAATRSAPRSAIPSVSTPRRFPRLGQDIVG